MRKPLLVVPLALVMAATAAPASAQSSSSPSVHHGQGYVANAHLYDEAGSTWLTVYEGRSSSAGQQSDPLSMIYAERYASSCDDDGACTSVYEVATGEIPSGALVRGRNLSGAVLAPTVLPTRTTTCSWTQSDGGWDDGGWDDGGWEYDGGGDYDGGEYEGGWEYEGGEFEGGEFEGGEYEGGEYEGGDWDSDGGEWVDPCTTTDGTTTVSGAWSATSAPTHQTYKEQSGERCRLSIVYNGRVAEQSATFSAFGDTVDSNGLLGQVSSVDRMC